MSNSDNKPFDLIAFQEAMDSLATLVAAEALLGNSTTVAQQQAMAHVQALAYSLAEKQSKREEAARLEREDDRKTELAAAKQEEADELPSLVQSFLEDPDSPFLEAFFCYTTKGSGKNQQVTSEGILLVHQRGEYIGEKAMKGELRDGAIMLNSHDKGKFAYIPFSFLSFEDLRVRSMRYYDLIDTLLCDKNLSVNKRDVKALEASQYVPFS